MTPAPAVPISGMLQLIGANDKAAAPPAAPGEAIPEEDPQKSVDILRVVCSSEISHPSQLGTQASVSLVVILLHFWMRDKMRSGRGDDGGGGGRGQWWVGGGGGSALLVLLEGTVISWTERT